MECLIEAAGIGGSTPASLPFLRHDREGYADLGYIVLGSGIPAGTAAARNRNLLPFSGSVMSMFPKVSADLPSQPVQIREDWRVRVQVALGLLGNCRFEDQRHRGHRRLRQ
jgi:hypothetical protein